MYAATLFLWSGTGATQKDVAQGTIDPERVAVLRGRTLAAAGGALPGVRVTVADHPELGYTLSSSDGTYNLVVNGGAALTADFELAGSMGMQRTQDVPWQTYVQVDDVVLKPFDSKVTAIDLDSTAPIQIASANPVTDADGTRQATLMFRSGTDATMHLPDGTAQQLGDLHVRATEYTVGANGDEAMPGGLPPSSAYTYAVELSVDEAVQAKATDVTFSKPVVTYVDDFLHFPAGTIVPAAYYDETRQAWIPATNGVVLKIVAAPAGVAQVDVTGDDVPDTGAALAEWGITSDELIQLGGQYSVGQRLWRVAVQHFTPWDYNWPYGCRAGDCDPPRETPPAPPYCPECQAAGSIVGLFNQTLGESARVVGTPFELDYESDRSPGYKEAYTLRVPLTGATIRSNLLRVDLEITIAGRHISQSFAPAANLKYTFTWDGTDGFGHELQGGQVAHVRIGYVYPAVYLQPDELQRSFAQFGGTPISGDRARQQITVWQEWVRPVGVLGAGSDALGGWTLSVHHNYDPQAKILYLGDGTRRTTEAVRSQIETVAGTGSTVGGGGSRALGTSLGYVRGVTAAADGGFYIADADNNVIRRVMPGGAIQTVAGGGSPADGIGDGLQATQAQLLSPSDVAVADDGTLYISDTGNARIRRVTPNGVITTIAGGGDPAALGDGGAATSASLRQARGIALAPDGTVFVADTGHDRVRRITPDGRISTAAGGGTPADGVGDGGPAASAALDHPYDVAVDAQGVLYVADGLHHRIRRIGADGRISTLAGNGGSGSVGDGGPAVDAQIGEPQGIAAAADGTVYFADRLHHVVRKVTADGFIARAAGTGSIGFSGEGGPPLQARLSFPQDVSIAKDGALFIADAANYRIRRSHVPLPGFTDADITIPSEDGGELFQFNQNGRHLRTVDAITGAVVYEFGYSATGRLSTITDGYGNVTTIQRDAAGNATAIVAPGGQQTTLTEDAAGRLASFADPAGDITRMTYSSDGLLASLTDPVGGVARFGYDSLGRLIRDEDVTGAAVTYARVDTPRGFEVATTSPSGLISVYEVEHLPGGDVRSTATTPSGAQSVMIFGQDGTTRITTAEGASVEATAGPDPRWGMAAPLLTKLVRATPSGLTDTITRSRTVSLTTPADPFSIGTLVDTRTENGRAWTRTYNAATRTLATSSPAGRHETLVYNAHDEIVRAEFPTGSAPLLYEYDTHGRLASVQRGAQKLTYAYDAANRLISRTDALGKATNLGWDAADRVTALTLPSGHRYQYGYDANGERTSITMPSGAIHSLARDALGRAVGYTTPEGGTGFTRAFDTDHRLTRFALPGDRSVGFDYDAGGRPSGMSDRSATTLDGQTALTYAPGDSTSRASTATRSVTGMFSASTSLSYDGALLVGEAVQNGAAAGDNGSLTYDYDTGFLLKSTTLVSGSDTVTRAITRDADKLMSQEGPFAITRTTSGLPTSYTETGFSLALGYDASTRTVQRTATAGGTQVYGLALTRDDAGRISRRVETVGGAAHTYDYTYTPDNFLASVQRDGALVEQYAYDVNGNRTSRRLPGGGTESSTYDARDRLTVRGSTAYAFAADGTLTSRGADTFRYTAEGELVEATIGGTTVRYQYDAWGRRIGRTVGSSRYAYFYGDPRRPNVVTAVREPSGMLTSFFYDEEGVLYALVRGTTKYYVGSDQVGTPRVVANSSGSVVKTIDYDSFGNVLADSDPGFDLPIGFAGGLTDPLTGLVRFGFRDYDPAAGRWTARDPLFFDAPSVNLYAYVDNDPLVLRDTNGLDWSWAGLKSGASAAYQSSKTYLVENWHSLVDKVASLVDDSVHDNVKLAHGTLDKGLGYIDTANEVGDTYLAAQDALGETSEGKQGAGLLKCGMKWLHKVLPVDWITQPATEALDRGIPHMERQHDTGTIHIGGPGRTSMRDVFEGERN